MGIRKFFGLCEHKYTIKKWRLCHYNEDPLTIVAGFECEKCGTRKAVYGLRRNVTWENKHNDIFDSYIWDSKWGSEMK